MKITINVSESLVQWSLWCKGEDREGEEESARALTEAVCDAYLAIPAEERAVCSHKGCKIRTPLAYDEGVPSCPRHI